MESMKLKLTCIVKPEENQYSALCLELDVASCGDTEEEAIANIKEAISLYLEPDDREVSPNAKVYEVAI